MGDLTKKKILIVEDNKNIAELEVQFLGEAGYATQLVPTASYAVGFLATDRYDAVVLDYQLPGGGAWDVLKAAQECTPRVPVIVATASGSETVAADAIQRGAADYLIKSTTFWDKLPAAVSRAIELAGAQEALRRSEANFHALVASAPDGFVVIRQGRIVYVNPALLRILGYAEASQLVGQPAIEALIHVEERARGNARLQEAQKGAALKAEERRFLSKDGDSVWTEVVGVNIHFEGGPAVAIFARDISDRKRLEQQLREKEEAILEAERQLARMDALTGIHNRRGCEDVFKREALRATRDEVPFSLALLDVDHFKKVNDTHGHDAGDQVLKAVAEVLRTELRGTDLAGRWGGEEMIALLPSTSREEALAMADRLRLALERRVGPMTKIPVTASFGAGLFSAGDTLEALVAKADRRLYEAKSSGRNCVR